MLPRIAKSGNIFKKYNQKKIIGKKKEREEWIKFMATKIFH